MKLTQCNRCLISVPEEDVERSWLGRRSGWSRLTFSRHGDHHEIDFCPPCTEDLARWMEETRSETRAARAADAGVEV